MGSPIQLSSLSRSSLVVLTSLMAANIALVVALLGSSEAVEVAHASPPETTHNLRLLTELSPEELGALVREKPAERSVPLNLTIEEEPLVCRVWGPFASESDWQALQQAILEEGEVIEVRTGEIKSPPDYLVYIDSDNNVDNARRLLKELQNQSLDAYIIAGGEFTNSVSVGVFSSRERADLQMEQLTNRGYRAQLESLERVQTVFHLVGSVPEAFETEAHEYSDCLAIASAR